MLLNMHTQVLLSRYSSGAREAIVEALPHLLADPLAIMQPVSRLNPF